MTSFTTNAPLDPIYAEYVEEQKPKAVRKKKKKLTKAAREERRRKEQEEFEKIQREEELRREYELSKKTEEKYRERWEEMSREIKLKQMKSELEEWEKKFNRVVKQKNEKIELILDEIATTEEIRKKSFSCQMQIMDYLTDALQTLQATSHLLYEKEASEILHDFYREVEESNAIKNKVKLNCESVSHATQLIAEQELLSDYQIFLDKRDDHVTGEIEQRYVLRDKIVKKMKALHRQLAEFHNSLMNVSLDAKKYERFHSLMERQRNFQDETCKLNEIEKRSSRLHADLQRDLLQEQREFKRRLNDLQLEQAYFAQIRKGIEEEMKLNDDKTHELYKIITSESFEVVKKYKKLLKFGELLLSLAATCRKFQTESEKVLLWGDFQQPTDESENDAEHFNLEIIELKNHVDTSEGELQTYANLMRNFWRRQAIAEAQIIILEQKKLELLKENQNYIDTIKSLSKVDNAEDLKEALKIKRAYHGKS